MQVFSQPRNPGQWSGRSRARTSLLSYGYQNPNARRIFREQDFRHDQKQSVQKVRKRWIPSLSVKWMVSARPNTGWGVGGMLSAMHYLVPSTRCMVPATRFRKSRVVVHRTTYYYQFGRWAGGCPPETPENGILSKADGAAA